MGVMRAALVTLFVVATVMLAVEGRMQAAVLLSAGIVAHGGLWLAMWKSGADTRSNTADGTVRA